MLTRRGYVLQNFENVLGLRLPAASLPDVGAASRSRLRTRSTTQRGSTSSSPALPTPICRVSPRTRLFRATCSTEPSATSPPPRGSRATWRTETAPWPAARACASAPASRSSAGPRRGPHTVAAARRARCSPPGSPTPHAKAATSPSSLRSPGRSLSRTSSGRASSCSTPARSLCGPEGPALGRAEPRVARPVARSDRAPRRRPVRFLTCLVRTSQSARSAARGRSACLGTPLVVRSSLTIAPSGGYCPANTARHAGCGRRIRVRTVGNPPCSWGAPGGGMVGNAPYGPFVILCRSPPPRNSDREEAER